MFAYDLYFTKTDEIIGRYYGCNQQEAIESFRGDCSSYRIKYGESVEFDTPIRDRYDITCVRVD